MYGLKYMQFAPTDHKFVLKIYIYIDDDDDDDNNNNIKIISQQADELRYTTETYTSLALEHPSNTGCLQLHITIHYVKINSLG